MHLSEAIDRLIPDRCLNMRRLGLVMLWILRFPFREILPSLAAAWIHVVLKFRLTKFNVEWHFAVKWFEYLEYDLHVLEKSLQVEHDRRDGIHDRAKSVLASASLASGLMFSAFGLWVKTDAGGNHLIAFASDKRAGIAFAVLLAMSSVSLVLGAIAAVASIGISRKYSMYLQNYRLLYDDDVAVDLKKKLVAFIHFEQSQNLIISNYSIAAFKHLRNGLIGLLLLICWIAFSMI